jgi:hypothetical protein
MEDEMHEYISKTIRLRSFTVFTISQFHSFTIGPICNSFCRETCISERVVRVRVQNLIKKVTFYSGPPSVARILGVGV